MTRRRSERSRWVEVFHIAKFNPDHGAFAKAEFEKAFAVLSAFVAVGRAVRAEPAKFGDGIRFIARKS